MACLVPIIPYDLKCHIAKIKYNLETENYDTFFEDFTVDVVFHQDTMSEDEDGFYSPVVSDNYNLKITYKPT